MESALFILNGLVVVAAIIMSLRDERLSPERPKTSYFRHSVAIAASKAPQYRRRAGMPTQARSQVRSGRVATLPDRPAGKP